MISLCNFLILLLVLHSSICEESSSFDYLHGKTPFQDEVDPSFGQVEPKEEATGPYVIRKQQWGFNTFIPFREPGYCMQSFNLIEPSPSRPFFQVATIFTRQPSCTSIFLPRNANVTDLVAGMQAKSEEWYVPTQAVMTSKLPAAFKKFSYIGFSEYVRGAKVQVRYVEQMSAFERHILSVAGYQQFKLIGLNVDGKPGHVGVWVKPAVSQNQRQAHYGLSLAECMQLDERMAQQGYTPVQFQAFVVAGAEAQCAAIWESGHPRTNHRIQMGTDLPAMVSEMQGSGLHPIQLSHYTDKMDVLHFVLLWSAMEPHHFPGLWEQTPIPMMYMPGAQEGFEPADLAKLDARVRTMMKKQHVMSYAYAISKNEQLKVAAAYGYSDPVSQTPLTTDNMFRIASISKSVTATGIYKLIEMGRLRLDQHIFGPGAIFGTRYGTKPYSDRLKALQLIHLLHHTEGGWSGHENDGYPDPTSLPNFTGDQLITYVLDNFPLNYTAGVHYRYCNFGYFLLGRIIEAVTGETYDEFFTREVVTPQMMTGGAHVGYNGRGGRLPKEIIYTDHLGEIYEFDIERSRGNSAWVMNVASVLKFVSGVNGFPRRRDLLQANTLRQMVSPTAVSNFTYASGFLVEQHKPNLIGYGHDGGLSGLSSYLWRRDDGIEFTFLMSGFSNVYTIYPDGIGPMLGFVDEDVTRWPSHDLYGQN